MQTGSEVGALLVDGLGDGVAVACSSQDLNFLRNMSFGVLQGSRMRNTKTGDLISLLLLRTVTVISYCYCYFLQIRCVPHQSCQAHLHSFRLAQNQDLLCCCGGVMVSDITLLRCMLSQFKVSMICILQDCGVKHDA